MSETKTTWYEYPENIPNSGESYLVTAIDEHGFKCVSTGFFTFLTGWIVNKGYKVIAWAEKPEPYTKKIVDMHQDAVTARKYLQGDPETLKILHIFEEGKE